MHRPFVILGDWNIIICRKIEKRVDKRGRKTYTNQAACESGAAKRKTSQQMKKVVDKWFFEWYTK